MRSLVACLLFAACAPSSETTRPEPSKTGMVTAGDRCQGGKCTCRSVDDFGRGGLSDENGVGAGMKRFEVRTGRGLDEVSITVEGRGTLLKSRELPDGACAYVDLSPGKHKLKFRARAADEAGGMVPAFFVNEWGARTHDWYNAFQFRCGGNQACTKDHLTEWAASDGKKPRGVWDPCGSTRVEDIKWEVRHAPDVKVLDLDFELVLNVYKFVPRFARGGACKGAGGVEVEDEPKDLPR